MKRLGLTTVWKANIIPVISTDNLLSTKWIKREARLLRIFDKCGKSTRNFENWAVIYTEILLTKIQDFQKLRLLFILFSYTIWN